MELATTQSVLMQIQPTIQRFARMLASVLQLEVEIVDEKLVSRRRNGRVWEVSWSPVERQLTPAPPRPPKRKLKKVVTQSRFDPLCEGCDSKEKLPRKSISGYACHFSQDRCVGVISLIAVTHEQQEHISDNLREFF